MNPETPQLPAHHVSPGLKLVLFLLAILLVGGLGYFTWMVNGETAKTEEIAPSVKDKTEEIAATDTTTTKDETADWKTYTNPVFAFSIKYPTGWSVDSAYMDRATSVDNDFEGRRFTLYQGPLDNNTRKIELTISGVESKNLTEQLIHVSDYKEASRKTLGSYVWSLGSFEDKFAYNLMVTPKSYKDVTTKNIFVTIAGYHFTGRPNDSKYTAEMATLVENIAATFTLIK